jgi:hypothetical protein
LKIKLHVNEERDEKLEQLMWSVWCDLEEELQERKPTSEIIELLASSEATKLLSGVPQFDLPSHVPGPTYVSSDLASLLAACASKSINPVDYEHLVALLESERLAFRGVTRGKIVASRRPDLTIQYNRLVSFRGWESQQHPPGTVS